MLSGQYHTITIDAIRTISYYYYVMQCHAIWRSVPLSYGRYIYHTQHIWTSKINYKRIYFPILCFLAVKLLYRTVLWQTFEIFCSFLKCIHWQHTACVTGMSPLEVAINHRRNETVKLLEAAQSGALKWSNLYIYSMIYEYILHDI